MPVLLDDRSDTLKIQDGLMEGRLDPLLNGGRLRFFHSTYTAPPGGSGAAVNIGMMRLPAGLMGVWARRCSIRISQIVTNGTLEVGYADYKDPMGNVIEGDKDAFADEIEINGQGLTPPANHSDLGYASDLYSQNRPTNEDYRGVEDFFFFDSLEGVVVVVNPFGATLPVGRVVTLSMCVITP